MGDSKRVWTREMAKTEYQFLKGDDRFPGWKVNDFDIVSGNNFERNMKRMFHKHLEEFIASRKQHGSSLRTNPIRPILFPPWTWPLHGRSRREDRQHASADSESVVELSTRFICASSAVCRSWLMLAHRAVYAHFCPTPRWSGITLIALESGHVGSSLTMEIRNHYKPFFSLG